MQSNKQKCVSTRDRAYIKPRYNRAVIIHLGIVELLLAVLLCISAGCRTRAEKQLPCSETTKKPNTKKKDCSPLFSPELCHWGVRWWCSHPWFSHWAGKMNVCVFVPLTLCLSRINNDCCRRLKGSRAVHYHHHYQINCEQELNQKGEENSEKRKWVSKQCKNQNLHECLI